MEIANQQVAEAIQQFEYGKVETRENIEKTVTVDPLKKDIISVIISRDYNEQQISEFQHSARHLDDAEINNSLADLMHSWRTDLGNLAKTKTGEDAERLYTQPFE